MTLKVHVIEATSDPVSAPAFVGQHWINTSTNRQWLAYGTSSVSDWGEVFTSSVLDEQIRDVIGTALTNSASITFNVNDPADTISATLTTTSVAAGSYGSASQVASFTVDAQGRLTAASNVTITPTAIGAQPADGDLTAVAGLTGTGLVTRTATDTMTTRTITGTSGRITVANGDGVTGNPEIDLATTAVIAGSYGSSGAVASFTVDSYGRLTSASNTTIDHTAISNIGTNTHAQIDAHIADTSNPHSVTAAQVGNTTAQWNADKLRGIDISTTAPTNGQVLAYNHGITSWEPQNLPAAITATNYTASAVSTVLTTSTSYVLLTDMSIASPPAGTYLVSFSVSSVNTTNGATRNAYILFVGGSSIGYTERIVGISDGAYTVVSFTAIVTVNGSQNIEVRWRVLGGTGTSLSRSLHAVRIA